MWSVGFQNRLSLRSAPGGPGACQTAVGAPSSEAGAWQQLLALLG